MDELKATIKTGGDLAGLKNCGILVDFSSQRCKLVTVQSVAVYGQDCKYRSYWKLVFSIVRSRASSMIRHTNGFPELLLGMRSKKDTEVAASIALFKRYYDAFSFAQRLGNPDIAAMVKRSALNSTPMQWAILFAKAGRWTTLTKQMEEFLGAISDGMMQTIINELANKEVRNHEQRGASSRSFGSYEKWAIPHEARLLEKFGRDEVQPMSCATVPTQDDLSFLFSPTHGPSGKNDSVPLTLVTGKQDWDSPSTVSVLHHFAESELLAFMHETDTWESVGAIWWMQFLPEGEILHDSATDTHFLVVRVLKGAVLVYPVLSLPAGQYVCDMTALRLLWRVFFTLDALRVLPTMTLSPLHRHVAKCATTYDQGQFLFERTGDPTEVVLWQCDRAFATVPEASLKALADELGAIEGDTLKSTEGKYTDKLALMLIMIIKDGLSIKELKALMLKRNLEEDDLAASYLDELTDDAVADVVLLGDQKQSKEIIKERKGAVKRRLAAATSTIKMVGAVAPILGPMVAPALSKKARSKAALELKGYQDRIYARLDTDCKSLIFDEKPLACRVDVDMGNGRYRCFYDGFKDKSVSWTKRGDKAAALDVLQLAWHWNELATGQGMPAHLQHLYTTD
jgi:hypothetical protein